MLKARQLKSVFRYFQNFKASLRELKEGRNYTELSLPIVAKTEEEAEKIKKRGEKTKQVLFNELIQTVDKALEDFPTDDYLNESRVFLQSKNFKQFNPKSQLTKLVLEIDEHIENLTFQNGQRLNLNDSADDGDFESEGELQVTRQFVINSAWQSRQKPDWSIRTATTVLDYLLVEPPGSTRPQLWDVHPTRPTCLKFPWLVVLWTSSP